MTSVSPYQVYKHVRLMQLQNISLYGKVSFKRKALRCAQLYVDDISVQTPIIQKEWEEMSEHDKKEYREFAAIYNIETA